MTLRFSPALQSFIAQRGSWKDFLDGGNIAIYTGAQPATPDLAFTGTLLVTLTSSAGALTNETRALGVITLSVGAAGGDNVTSVTLNGQVITSATVNWDTSLTQTAADVCLNINRNPANKLVIASNVGAVITLTAVPGLGATLNAKSLAAGVAGNMVPTITTTTFGSGTGGGTAGIAAVNGLKMDYDAAAGLMTKDTTQTWSGTAVATGTAGWFRYYSSLADAGALDSGETLLRMDCAVATSGAEMNATSTAIASGALQTLSAFSFTIPAQ